MKSDSIPVVGSVFYSKETIVCDLVRDKEPGEPNANGDIIDAAFETEEFEKLICEGLGVPQKFLKGENK